MKIAYTMAPGRGDTDLLLAGLADTLAARGLRLCGTVQTNSECGDDKPCDMDVRVLPDGPEFRISQSLGKGARGCRLDPEALEVAVGTVEAALESGADLLIINKFGKHEADGRGFRETIGKAMMMEIPVVVGLNRLNIEAFQSFCGGLAEEVAPNPQDLLRWVESNAAGVEAA